MTTHGPHRSWCTFCVMGRCERAAQEIRCSRRFGGSSTGERDCTSPSRRESDCARERPLVGGSQSDGIIERAVGLVAGQARTLKAALEHRIGTQSPARRKDIVLAGGTCVTLDEQVRPRQRRKDTAAKTTRAKGQHTDSGVWRKDPAHARQTSERRKVGAAVPPRSVCWHAELIVRGSGCHRAGTGDQDKVGEHQESARVGEMGRWQNTRDASHSLVPRWQ